MKYLALFLFCLLVTTNAYAGTTNLVCNFGGTLNLGSGLIETYRNEIRRITVKSRNGNPVSMGNFDEGECEYKTTDDLFCSRMLPFSDGTGYFLLTEIINSNNGNYWILEKEYKTARLMSTKTGKGYCKKSKQKKLF